MQWTDINDIAIALCEAHPEVDVISIRFTDLQKMVMELDEFDDDPKRCNERILEAIQQAWLDEAN